MNNKFMQDFMNNFQYDGLTFDDVSLVTQYSDFLPDETSLSTNITKNVKLNMPFASAAMDTVTESEMAIAMACLGGIGVIHKNLSVEEQAAKVAKVKHYLNGVIKKPVTFNPNMTLGEVNAIKEKENIDFSGFPIVDENGILVGILTARDVKFATSQSNKISEIMTRNLITAPEGTLLQEAFDIMSKHRVGKLPTVDSEGKLSRLYSFLDVKTLIDNDKPNYNRDSEHRLIAAAAIGPYDEERAAALIAKDVDVLVVDTAHGHSKGVIETVKILKDKYGDKVDILAGNIATGEAAKELLDAGADGVKVGIGPGSICTTRVVAGVGIPQITAIHNAKKLIGDEIPIIADGGIQQSGDIAKAIAAGASCVMMGSVLAGTEESPGRKIYHQGRKFVVYRGMGSLEAMEEAKGSRERYGQKDEENSNKLVPQGIEGLIPFKGPVEDVIHQYAGGLKYSLGYCGTKTIQELKERAKFIKVSGAGLKEAHPHDIQIVNDAPNYTAGN